jgi:hypothetical protein
MKSDIKRKLSLHLTEEEAHVFSAGLYALEMFEPLGREDQLGADFEVKEFGDSLMRVIRSLQSAFGEAGLWPETVSRGMESWSYIASLCKRDAENEVHEDRNTRPSTWSPTKRGLPGITFGCEAVLQQLLTWAWKHPERWVSATCSRACGEEDENWLPHIDFLVKLGRITPKAIDGREGWIVPSAKEWRQLNGKPRRPSVVSIAQPVA